MPSRAERRQSTWRAGSPDMKRRYCQNCSPGPARLRPCRPWITVAAILRASRISRGKVSASVRAVPLARWVALTSWASARRLAAIRLTDTRRELADHAGHGLAVGAGGEGERHAVLEDRLGHVEDVVDRGRQPPVDEGARTGGEHQRLAGARARSPGDQLADLAAVRPRTRRAHQSEDRRHHGF